MSNPLSGGKQIPKHGIEHVTLLLAVAIDTPSGNKFRKLRNDLLDLPPEFLVTAAATAIRSVSNSRTFDRLARLLAEIGGDIAADALVTNAFTQKRFPRLASRALAMCRHPSVLPALLELVSKGNMKQCRAAAKYLLRHQGGLGVEPLCHILRERRGKGAVAVDQVFTEAGGPSRLATLLLSDKGMAPLSRANGVHALESVFSFDGTRFLERQSRGWFTSHKKEAAEALEILRQRKTLLRPSSAAGETVLLRAASGPGSSSPEELLRASDSNDVDAPQKVGLFTRLAAIVSRNEA